LRPTEGMASKTSTDTPAAASVSAAINPAGPPPITATGRAPSACDDIDYLRSRNTASASVPATSPQNAEPMP
jgi:hypothetical protein